MSSIDDRLNQIIRELIGSGITLGQAVEAFEGKYISAAMAASRGNITKASRALGVHRNTLHNKLRSPSLLPDSGTTATRRRTTTRKSRTSTRPATTRRMKRT